MGSVICFAMAAVEFALASTMAGAWPFWPIVGLGCFCLGLGVLSLADANRY